MFNNSTADYDQLRKETLQAFEIPALFESVAEIAGVSESDDTLDAETDDGVSINAYGSPLSLWELKKGYITQTAPTSRSLWSRLKWGVCQDVIERMNGEGRRPEGVAISDENPRLSSRVDMEVSTDLGETWEPVIAKNVAGTSMSMWRNSVGDWIVPEAVLLEAHHHMLVRGVAKVHVAALFSGTSVRHFVVERDDELVADIADAAERFWACVDENRRPGANTKADQKIIARLNGIIDPKEQVIDLRGDAEIQRLLAEKERIKSEEKALKSAREEIDSVLNARLDGSASAIISDTQQLRWVRTAAQTVSYSKPASSYLRATKIDKRAAGTGLESLVEGNA